MEQAVSWEEGPMLRTTVLALQQPMGRDLEPQGKRTPGPPSYPTGPKTSVVIFLLSKELALTPKASPDDKLMAFDDSPGEASDLRISRTCEARADGPSTASTCGQVLWVEDPMCAGRQGLTPASGSSPFWPVGKSLPVSRTFGSGRGRFSEARSKLQQEEPFLFLKKCIDLFI